LGKPGIGLTAVISIKGIDAINEPANVTAFSANFWLGVKASFK
jgi:hypothetical protein